MKIMVIGNPAAGRKAGLPTNAATLEAARAALARQGIATDVQETERAGDATRLAAEAVRHGYEMVVAAGGDGTVGEVTQSLVGTNTILGILPLGSVMNSARMLHVPRDLDQAAALLTRGRVARIDVGKVRDYYFLEAAGVGLDAGISAYANQIDAGRWTSAVDLLRFVLYYRPHRLTLQLDGKVVNATAMMVVVANGPYYGPGLPLVPDAKLDDHLFTIRVFRAFSKLKLLLALVDVVRSRGVAPGMLEFKARQVTVAACHPLLTHADAHIMGTTPVTFEVVPAGLHALAGEAAPGELEPLTAETQARESGYGRAMGE